jgi:transcriptional regulator with XRE-family HTH domain
MNRTRGAAKLEEWLHKSGESQQGLARRIGCHQSHICRILQGKKVPSLSMAAVIKGVTRIPVEDWIRQEAAHELAVAE